MTKNTNLLHSDFIIELYKTCLSNPKILGICHQELKFSYLANNAEKQAFKFLYETYDVTKVIPTIGVIGQQFADDKDVIAFLSQVKKANKIDNEQLVIEQLCNHIKKIRLRDLVEETASLFNNPQKRELAYSNLQKKSEEIANFSFKQKYYKEVFENFNERNAERQRKAESENTRLEKIPFGIHQLDSDTAGGIKRGSSALFMARSGGGKSTALRWLGIHNARLGHRVVHFQLEGTEQDCFDLYDSAWTGILTEDMSIGNIKDSQRKKIEKVRQDILLKGGKIFVYASESFDSLYIEDAREILMDIQTIHGPIDLILFDYLELANIRGSYSGESGERRRREKIANQLTNLAGEFNAALASATQANDISPKDYNNPDFRLTRHHISEFKGAVKPFSYFITINGTDEQRERNMAILYEDKFRHHRAGRSIPIYQSLDNGRFYDSARTINEFLSED